MTERHHNALPKGYRLENFRIERVLGAGGYAITYLARETAPLSRDVAIKEYLPASLAMRDKDGVSVHSLKTADEDSYLWGLKRFAEEAQTLVRFKHPNIVPVLAFIEANGTAYMVMEYQDGDSLAGLMKIHAGKFDEDDLRAIALPLLDGLAEVHEAGILHRDIKPANIYIRADGSPVLLDFGAARHALGGKTQSLTAVVTPGYAPFEQYTSRGEQGPWTDLYALGATLYTAIAGVVPPDAADRMQKDDMIPAVTAGRGRYGREILEAIDRTLAVDARDRPQSVAEFRDLIGGGRTQGAAASAPVRGAPARRRRRDPTIQVGDGPGRRDRFVLSSLWSAPGRPLVWLPAVLGLAALAGWAAWSGRLDGLMAPTPGVGVAETEGETKRPATRQPGKGPDGAAKGRAGRQTDPRTRTRPTPPPRADAKAGTAVQDCALCPQLIVVPAGSFLMGSPTNEPGREQAEGPRHRVAIPKKLAFGRFEVTFAEWDACVKAGGCKHRPNDRGWGRGTKPVINVSWRDATSYARWLSRKTGQRYRLPSEAEWEYAARAGTTAPSYWRGESKAVRANCKGCGSRWDYKKTAPVGRFRPNGFGLYDMLGNVWEWVDDCWTETYDARGSGRPAPPKTLTPGGCEYRVVRGGSFLSPAGGLRAARRSGDKPGARDFATGFRVVREVE